MHATVVGSGPNGLTAAIRLAEAGLSVTVLEAASTIGGGTRTEELTLPGFHHDVCAAIHPLGAASPVFATMPLEEHGLRWLTPEVQYAHPLPDGTARASFHSIDTTIEFLGRRAGRRYQRVVGSISEYWDDLADAILRPLLRPSPNFARLVRMAYPATRVLSQDEDAQTLLIGCAAHTGQPLSQLFTAGPGLVLAALAHVRGWPVAAGGTAAITDALASYLRSMGGVIETDRKVRARDDLPESDIVMWNTAPWILDEVYGSDLPSWTRRAIRTFKPGVASYKMDFALDGPVPWTAEECRRAGTVHVGGTAAEVIAAERAVNDGAAPDKPFVLVAQQSVIDPSRAPEGKHTVWAYSHVPEGFRRSVAAQIEGQIERFAPGFRDRILAKSILAPVDLEAYNANYRGGAISAGALDVRQTIARPWWSPTPYRVPVKGVYLCSSSTPPGPGVHGMSGHHAAMAALSDLGGA